MIQGIIYKSYEPLPRVIEEETNIIIHSLIKLEN